MGPMDPTATLTQFRPFTLTHAAAVLVCGAITIALIFLGMRGRNKPLGVHVHRAWLMCVLLIQIINIVYFALPAQLDPATSLPLHICDLAGIVAIADLACRRGGILSRLLMTMMVYWGVGLSVQGFVIPVIRDGPDTFRFYLFFASHLSIVATGLYDVFVRQFRPQWRDGVVAYTVTVIYVAVILPLNMLTGWNYGYVADPPPPAANPTAFLGPWPLRVLWMAAMGAAGYVVLTLVLGRPRTHAHLS
jgi:hypothetical integral membrane protein (TIGR02206 family)